MCIRAQFDDVGKPRCCGNNSGGLLGGVGCVRAIGAHMNDVTVNRRVSHE